MACKWRGLPPQFGNRHTVYTRMNRWSKSGVLDRVFEHLQREQILRIKIGVVSLDGATVRVHPDGAGARKKRPPVHWKSRGGWTAKIHPAAANDRTALTLSLSPGQAHDAPEGRWLPGRLGPEREGLPLLMDRACEGDETRRLAVEMGFAPVAAPRRDRVEPWEYDRELYRKRNEVERLFGRLKAFRRVSTRFDKLDALFRGSSTSLSSLMPCVSVNTPSA